MNPVLQQLIAFARRSPVAVIGLVVILVLGGADYFLWQRQAEFGRRRDRVRQEGEAMQLALAGFNRVHTQLEAVRGALAHVDKHLVTEAELAENLDYFYQIEKKARVRLSDLNQFNSAPITEDHPFRTVPFSMRLTGSYQQVLAFVRELESGPRLLKIRTYRFARAVSAPDAIALELSVELLGRP